MMDTVEQPGKTGFRYGLGLASVDLPCGVRVWGHGGDIDGYHGIMVKPLHGQALSMTVTEGVETETPDHDPRSVVRSAFYCR
jgi:D-alanyl-D-alanine carboxypeptidase